MRFVDLRLVWALNASSSPLLISQYVLPELRVIKRFEPFMITVMASILRSVCPAGGVLVDSGANDGAWSLLAASMGCTAVAIEPQPFCVGLLNAAAQENGPTLSSRLKVVNAILAPITSRHHPGVPTDTCIGEMQALPDGRTTSAITHRPMGLGRSNTTSVPVVSLDALVEDTLADNHVDLWHVDTEGAELLVLRSAARLFASRLIDRVILELVPSRSANVSKY